MTPVEHAENSRPSGAPARQQAAKPSRTGTAAGAGANTALFGLFMAQRSPNLAHDLATLLDAPPTALRERPGPGSRPEPSTTNAQPAHERPGHTTGGPLLPAESAATASATRALITDDPTDADDLAAAELTSSDSPMPEELVAPGPQVPTLPSARLRATGTSIEPSETERPPSATASKADNSERPASKPGEPTPSPKTESATPNAAPSASPTSRAGISAAAGNGAVPHATSATPPSSAPAVRGTSSPTQSNSTGAATPAANARAVLARLGTLSPSRVALSQAPAQDDPALTAQVAGALGAALKQGGGAVTLRLRPEHLGVLTIDLALKGDAVTATLRAESGAARELLDRSLPLLRESLEARGLRIERLSVTQPAEPATSPAPEADRPPTREQNDGSGHAPDGRWSAGQHHGGEESHADRRHAGSTGRTDASDAGDESGAAAAEAEAEAQVNGSRTPEGEQGRSTALRLDALA